MCMVGIMVMWGTRLPNYRNGRCDNWQCGE